MFTYMFWNKLGYSRLGRITLHIIAFSMSRKHFSSHLAGIVRELKGV